jgi:hypothetical protein
MPEEQAQSEADEHGACGSAEEGVPRVEAGGEVPQGRRSDSTHDVNLATLCA